MTEFTGSLTRVKDAKTGKVKRYISDSAQTVAFVNNNGELQITPYGYKYGYRVKDSKIYDEFGRDAFNIGAIP